MTETETGMAKGIGGSTLIEKGKKQGEQLARKIPTTLLITEKATLALA